MIKYIKLLWNGFLSALPHINITLATVLLVIFVTDRFNSSMKFINNDITKWMLCVFCVTSILQAIVYAYTRRKAIKSREESNDRSM